MIGDLYDGPCEAGCQSFHGGERKHHPDCKHYPHSLTKLHADRIEELEAKLAKAMQTLSLISTYQSYRLPSPQDIARTTLAELKGQDDE